MHIPTIFDIKYESGLTKYTIEEEKLHHLSHVLRIKNDDLFLEDPKCQNQKGT